MRKHRVRDDLLPTWEDVRGETEWTGLLVGNGGSIAIWPQFRYSSLYEVATSDVPHPLTAEDVRLFEAFETENFEQILASLKIAGIVTDALGEDTSALAERYESVQTSLFEAVHAVHVPWDHVARKTIPRLFSILQEYTFVYSTNYDLLLYWASMHEGGPPFLDYCWNDDGWFSSGNTEIFRDRDDWTRVLFLHGGIHLRRSREGGTRKVIARDGAILEQFETGYGGGESPLLISEGESSDKMASIRTSDYLTFAHGMFSVHEDGLVIFGHSLGDQDNHLVAPMKSWRGRKVAISMRPSDDREALVQEQDRLKSRLSPMKEVVFFDASTHPLGGEDLAARDPAADLFRR
jgi:Domain of unknown function (DUF4917)